MEKDYYNGVMLVINLFLMNICPNRQIQLREAEAGDENRSNDHYPEAIQN